MTSSMVFELRVIHSSAPKGYPSTLISESWADCVLVKSAAAKPARLAVAVPPWTDSAIAGRSSVVEPDPGL